MNGLLLFSEPYLENRLVLVGRRGADVSATTLAALKGRRIAIVEGYAYGSGVEGAGPAFVRSQGEEDSLRQLLASKVDYALMDELVVNYLVENHAEQAQARLQLGTTRARHAAALPGDQPQPHPTPRRSSTASTASSAA